jgi:DNA-binding NtrC family response regulator
VFLDEVSEIPMPTQIKLLRFLQERTFERVGGNETLKVDVRIIAASNRDLKQRIAEGHFREDLYYRLNVVTLEIPPLRERASDIPELAMFFVRRYAQENGKRIEGLSDEALSVLSSYPFPGNVRELENAMERAVVLCDSARIELRHLPAAFTKGGDDPDAPPRIPGSTIYDLERYAILKTLEACKGSTSKAATILGISPRKIQYKLHEYASSGGEAARGVAFPGGSGGEDAS